LLFVWHTGEESGLQGSRWFTDNSTVPRDSIVAQINTDMIGRGGPKDESTRDPAYIQVIGSRRLSTELGDLAERVNRESTIDSYQVGEIGNDEKGNREDKHNHRYASDELDVDGRHVADPRPFANPPQPDPEAEERGDNERTGGQIEREPEALCEADRNWQNRREGLPEFRIENNRHRHRGDDEPKDHQPPREFL
jgi:hypothetical protein